MNNLYGAIGTTVTVLMLFYIYLLRNRVKNSKQEIISQSMLQHRYSSRKNNSRTVLTGSKITFFIKHR